MRWLAALLLLVGAAGSAWGQLNVDRVSVAVEKRDGHDWCRLDVQVSGLVPLSVGALAAVIQDYPSYTTLFPHVQDLRFEQSGGDTLLSETVAVSVLGVENINRFTLRLTADSTSTGFHLPWVQENTDGSIDSLEGEWLLQDRSLPGKPQTWVSYRTKSAVRSTAFGQDLLLRMFLGGETKNIVDAVVRAAGLRTH